jgi:hypothetical protein
MLAELRQNFLLRRNAMHAKQLMVFGARVITLALTASFVCFAQNACIQGGTVAWKIHWHMERERVKA